jgi:hypothetical protein
MALLKEKPDTVNLHYKIKGKVDPMLNPCYEDMWESKGTVACI